MKKNIESNRSSSEPSNVKYDKPKILLVDLPDVDTTLIAEGYLVESGTLGTPYKVTKDDGMTPVISDYDLPNHTEQEIVVLDLLATEILECPTGEKHTSDGANDWWVSSSKGVVDPRARAAAAIQGDFNTILGHGGVFIIFAAPRFRQDITYGYLSFRRLISTQSLVNVNPILTATLLLLLSATSCLAQAPDDCAFNPTPCEAYTNADAIFIAKVTQISPETIRIWQRDKDYDQTANVLIEKTYKGIKRNRLVLHQLGRNIAPKFILGQRYLFYANFDRRTKKWEVRRCGRTRMTPYVQDDLHYLDGLPASLNKTRIAGEVTRYERDEENPAGTTQRLSGVRIRIKGEGKEYEVVTDAHGIYELNDVPAGKYQIKPDMPAGLVLLLVMHYGPFDPSKLQSFNIELNEGGCSGASFILTSNRKLAKPTIGND